MVQIRKEIQLIELHFFTYFFLFIVVYRTLLNLLEMQTVIKQAICVSVLQMCCKYGNKQR